MDCSQPKLSRTGLRIVGSFLKVKLCYNIFGTQVPLRFAEGSGLMDNCDAQSTESEVRSSDFEKLELRAPLLCSHGGVRFPPKVEYAQLDSRHTYTGIVSQTANGPLSLGRIGNPAELAGLIYLLSLIHI